MKCDGDVLSTLRALRRRLSAQLLAGKLARALFGAAGVVVILAVLDCWRPASWDGRTIGWIAGVAGSWAILAAWRAQPSLATTAGIVDRLAATRDRLATALEFRQAAEGDWRAVALHECTAYVRGRDLAPHLPWRMPSEARWLWVPLLAIAMLRWDASRSAAALADQEASGAQAVAPTVRELQKLAEALKRRGGDDRSEEMKRLAEELQRSAERLNAEAKNHGEPDKSKLRELSALEDLVRQMQEQQRAQLTPEEMQKMAVALREHQETEEAGRQLEKGDLAKSAASLEKAAEELEEKGEKSTADAIQKALKSALERLAQQQPLSPSAQQLAQQNSAASEAMKKLAELLRKMPGQRGASPGQPGTPMSSQQLQKLLSALEDMKQDAGGQGGGPGAPKGNDSQILMQAFDHKSSDDPGGGKNMVPTGQPGGEKDEGTTASPFADQASPATPKGADVALRGLAGAGESMSQLLPGATSDDSKARRKYKDLYEAMAPAAEEAVQQENIPLGSRFFVKRYFEAIRPKE